MGAGRCGPTGWRAPRSAQCVSIITLGEAVIHASLARRASSDILGFARLDHPAVDPPEWRHHVVLSLRDGCVQARDLALDYHVREPFASTLDENYRRHAALTDTGGAAP